MFVVSASACLHNGANAVSPVTLTATWERIPQRDTWLHLDWVSRITEQKSTPNVFKPDSSQSVSNHDATFTIILQFSTFSMFLKKKKKIDIRPRGLFFWKKIILFCRFSEKGLFWFFVVVFVRLFVWTKWEKPHNLKRVNSLSSLINWIIIVRETKMSDTHFGHLFYIHLNLMPVYQEVI